MRLPLRHFLKTCVHLSSFFDMPLPGVCVRNMPAPALYDLWKELMIEGKWQWKLKYPWILLLLSSFDFGRRMMTKATFQATLTSDHQKSSGWLWWMVKSQNPHHCRTGGGFMPLLTIWQIKVFMWSVSYMCTFPYYDLWIFFTKYKTLRFIFPSTWE